MLLDISNDLANTVGIVNRINDLASLEITDELTIKLISITCVVAGGIAAICFVCSLMFNYIKTSFKNIFNPEEAGDFPNYMEITRGIILCILISIYPIAAVALTGTIEFFNKMSSPVSENSLQLASLAEEYSNMIALSYDDAQQAALESAKAGETGDSDDQAAAEIQLKAGADADPDKKSANSAEINDSYSIRELLALLNPATWVALGIQACLHLIFTLIHLIISSIAAILFKFFIIIGPLAIAFSILPIFEKQISIWFGTVMNTGFVFTTLNILDRIALGVFEYIIKESNSISNITLLPASVITLDAVLLVVYLSSFWLTSKFVGKGDAGRVISKMVAVGTGMAALATGGAGAIAKGGNIANAVSAAGNTIAKN